MHTREERDARRIELEKLDKDTIVTLVLDLEEIALTDFLTQLYNRYTIM